ncbi:MAG: hypothetical protein SOW50_03140, partial [Lachnospiraceae bacterium]|nr:hypothetical protein [Lachnospiraceae bacterium]
MQKSPIPNILILNPYSLNHIGKISNFTEFEWNKKAASQADVELWCPLIEQNTALLKKENLIYLDDDHIAVIISIDEELNDEGEKILDVKALTLEKYLNYRMITGTYYATNSYVSNIMKDVVNNNAINPVDEKRKIPFLEFGICEENKGGPIEHQKTGGQLNEELEELASTYSLCFNVTAKLKQKKLLVNIYAGT